MKWIVFYDSKGRELGSYTAAETFAGEMQSTAELLAYENGIRVEEITVKEEER